MLQKNIFLQNMMHALEPSSDSIYGRAVFLLVASRCPWKEPQTKSTNAERA